MWSPKIPIPIPLFVQRKLDDGLAKLDASVPVRLFRRRLEDARSRLDGAPVTDYGDLHLGALVERYGGYAAAVMTGTIEAAVGHVLVYQDGPLAFCEDHKALPQARVVTKTLVEAASDFVLSKSANLVDHGFDIVEHLKDSNNLVLNKVSGATISGIPVSVPSFVNNALNDKAKVHQAVQDFVQARVTAPALRLHQRFFDAADDVLDWHKSLHVPQALPQYQNQEQVQHAGCLLTLATLRSRVAPAVQRIVSTTALVILSSAFQNIFSIVMMYRIIIAAHEMYKLIKEDEEEARREEEQRMEEERLMEAERKEAEEREKQEHEHIIQRTLPIGSLVVSSSPLSESDASPRALAAHVLECTRKMDEMLERLDEKLERAKQEQEKKQVVVDDRDDGRDNNQATDDTATLAFEVEDTASKHTDEVVVPSKASEPETIKDASQSDQQTRDTSKAETTQDKLKCRATPAPIITNKGKRYRVKTPRRQLKHRQDNGASTKQINTQEPALGIQVRLPEERINEGAQVVIYLQGEECVIDVDAEQVPEVAHSTEAEAQVVQPGEEKATSDNVNRTGTDGEGSAQERSIKRTTAESMGHLSSQAIAKTAPVFSEDVLAAGSAPVPDTQLETSYLWEEEPTIIMPEWASRGDWALADDSCPAPTQPSTNQFDVPANESDDGHDSTGGLESSSADNDGEETCCGYTKGAMANEGDVEEIPCGDEEVFEGCGEAKEGFIPMDATSVESLLPRRLFAGALAFRRTGPPKRPRIRV